MDLIWLIEVTGRFQMESIHEMTKDYHVRTSKNLDDMSHGHIQIPQHQPSINHRWKQNWTDWELRECQNIEFINDIVFTFSVSILQGVPGDAELSIKSASEGSSEVYLPWCSV